MDLVDNAVHINSTGYVGRSRGSITDEKELGLNKDPAELEQG